MKYEILNQKILEKIENYEDIHQITSYLMIKKKSNNKDEVDEARNILDEISRNYVSFTSKNHNSPRHHYTYYEMFIILINPIVIFRKIINLNISDDYVNSIFLAALKFSITGRGNIKRDFGFNDDQIHNFYYDIRNSKSIESAMDIIVENRLNLNFMPDDIKVKIYSFISDEIGSWMNDVYFNLKIDNHEENIINYRKHNNILKKMIYIDYENDKFNNKVIRVNESSLNNIVSLGLIDDLLESLKNKILNYNSDTILNGNSLIKIVNWYKKSKTELCPDVDHLPSLVASILEFDIRKKIGMFDKDYGIKFPIKNKTNFSKDGYLIVTGLIRRFLFKDGEFIDLYNPYLNFFPKEKSDENLLSISEYINNIYENGHSKLDKELEDLNNLDNELMKVWANFKFNKDTDLNSKEYKAIINRFKRLPIYLKEEKKEEKKIWNLYFLIQYQKNKSKEIGYPVDSVFPFPLWANFDSIDKAKYKILRIDAIVKDNPLFVRLR